MVMFYMLHVNEVFHDMTGKFFALLQRYDNWEQYRLTQTNFAIAKINTNTNSLNHNQSSFCSNKVSVSFERLLL